MTKKTLFFKFSVLVFTTIVFALTLHGISHALTFTHIYVDAVNGTNGPGSGAAAKPYKSITYALLLSTRNDLPDPWHVHIRPGTYDADLAKPVNAREIFPLKLRREMIFEGTTTAEECVIDGQHTGAAIVPILHGKDTEGVTIRNLTIQNSLRTRDTGGIIVHDPTGTKETPSRLEGCVVHNNKGGGMWTNMPFILTDNTFSNNGGAGVATTRSIAATSNIFSGNSLSGLTISGDSTGDISKNTFQNNKDAGFAVGGHIKANVTHNIFTSNRSSRRKGGGFSANTFTGDVTDNTFTGNSINRDSGGGFYVRTFTGDVTDNTFTGNSASGGGGGFFVDTFTGDVTDNTFTGNSTHLGGGFYAEFFTGDVTDNTFTGNTGNQGGGGFYVSKTFTGDAAYNTFTRNTGNQGGGFGLGELAGTVHHNIFDSNQGDYAAGFELKTSKNTVEVFNNIFFNNAARRTGGSVGTRHATHFMNNLFMISDKLSEGVVSQGAAVWLNSPECQFHNNIFSGVQTAIATEGSLDLPITHNLFHDIKVDFVESGGNNLGNDLLFWELVAVNASDNLEGAPLLVDPVTLRDFHLQAASPAINAGTNQFAPSDDFDGVARPVGKTVDIGPYEYGGKPPQTADEEPPETDDKEPPVNTPVVETLKVKIYWTTAGKIQRANLDGSNIEPLVTTGLRYPHGIALDVAGGKMYWTDFGTRSIQRANLDGSNIETLVTTGLERPRGIALDVTGDKMYWTDSGTRSIQRANLDGSNIETLLTELSLPDGIALDVSARKMYWRTWGPGLIQRANLDGTNVETLTTANDPQAIALDVASGKMYWTDGFGGIKRNNLDGSQVEILITDLNFLTDIDLDIAGNKMYWIGGEGGLIQRANLDGSNIEDIASQKLALYSGIALGISRQSLDNRTPQRLEIVSGVDQKGSIKTALANPFVVKVSDRSGSAFAGVAVAFAITAGGGSLSIESATTDADGRAESTLTLGPDVGTNTVSVSVSGIQQTITFTAVSTPPETAAMIITGTITNTDGSPAEAGLLVTATIGSTTQTAVSAAGGNYRVTFINFEGVVARSLDTVEVQVLREATGESAGETVQLSSEQIIAQRATIDLQFLPPTAAEYLLSVPSGVSLIHVPLKVTAVDGVAQTITSIADLYDALGSASRVNFLITYDSKTQGWLSYFVPSDKGTSADAALIDDTGIIAGLRTPVSIRLRGDPLGTDRNSAITLNQGLNLVGLPLRDSRIMRVSDLFALDGIGGNVPVIILTHDGEFKVVGRADDPGDIEITGGQSFILTAQRTATVSISGDGWTNTSGTAAAPSLAMKGIQVTDTTPVLALRGAIADEGTGLNKPSFRVTVKNLSTGRTATAVTGSDEADYRLTVVDIETGQAATIGDTLEISAQSPNPFIGVQPLRYTVTAEDVKRSRIQLPELLVYEIPAETQLLPNYPNPFNPETWIPYRLAEDAFVTLIIYDRSGRVVRTLEVGHRIAAAYESRSKAVYWDGRNEVGERVASGVYFYHLSAGDYSATRRMVILK